MHREFVAEETCYIIMLLKNDTGTRKSTEFYITN
jgi:hypothetical protein